MVFGLSYTQEEVESIARLAGFNFVSVEKISGWPCFQMKLRK
jgi:hypothetical protein